jgi:hypothetical protein
LDPGKGEAKTSQEHDSPCRARKDGEVAAVGREYHLLAVTRDEVALDDAGDEVAARERLSAAMSTVESRLEEHRRRSDAICEE